MFRKKPENKAVQQLKKKTFLWSSFILIEINRIAIPNETQSIAKKMSYFGFNNKLSSTIIKGNGIIYIHCAANLNTASVLFNCSAAKRSGNHSKQRKNGIGIKRQLKTGQRKKQ